MDGQQYSNILSTGRRPLCKWQFSGDIDLLIGSEEDFQQLIERLENSPAGYCLRISSDKSKILVNGIKLRLSTNIWMNGKTLEEVDQLKYRIQANQRWNINKGSKHHTGQLGHDKASNSTMGKQSSFRTNIKLYKSFQYCCTV